MNSMTRKTCLWAVGIALFVALSLCLQVPIVQNYYLCLGYAVMAVYCYSFGPFAGATVGALGVVFYCLVISGLRGMPGWALANVLIGFALGIVFRATKGMKSLAVKAALNAGAIIAATALGMLGVKSLLESALYAQPVAVRIAKNTPAFVADAAVLLLSLPICMSLDAVAQRLFPGEVKA